MAIGKRHTAREMAVQMLYQSELGESPLPQVFSTFDVARYLAADGADEDEPPPVATRARVEGDRAAFARRKRQVEDAFHYAQELVRGTVDHRGEIDALIRAQADNWRLERMPAVDRNILRLAVYEMLFEKDVPKLVVLDEAIELAKKFGSEQSGRFVNGLLDGLLKQHTFPGSLK
jgi:N utilization substance protein B